MPRVELYLPPRAYTVWRRAAPVHLVAAVLIARWIERARQRRQLDSLSDHELRDIGITRVEAVREAQRPFWR